MNKSESILKISLALVKAQSKMGAAVKGASNPYFKSKYSDLNSVIEACKEHLNSEGLTFLQPVVSDETGDYVETILLHESGEYISSRMKLKTQKENDMQAYGSSISYARRYGLQAILGIPSSEDDDAEKTMSRPANMSAKPTSPSKVDVFKTRSTSGTIAAPAVDTSASSEGPKPVTNVVAPAPFRRGSPVKTEGSDPWTK